MKDRKKLIVYLICGLLGCLCYGGGDWLMMYGNATCSSSVWWLTEGVANISSFRNTLAMAMAFPGVIFYGIALFGLEELISHKKEKKIYHYLNVFGLTPWLALHLLYIMIIYIFGWMNGNGYSEAAIPIAEALWNHISWVVLVSEILMLPVFMYWFIICVRKHTALPRWVAFTNVLIIFGILKTIISFVPMCPFRIGFTNGLMSESMVVFFAVIYIARLKQVKGEK